VPSLFRINRPGRLAETENLAGVRLHLTELGGDDFVPAKVNHRRRDKKAQNGIDERSQRGKDTAAKESSIARRRDVSGWGAWSAHMVRTPCRNCQSEDSEHVVTSGQKPRPPPLTPNVQTNRERSMGETLR